MNSDSKNHYQQNSNNNHINNFTSNNNLNTSYDNPLDDNSSPI